MKQASKRAYLVCAAVMLAALLLSSCAVKAKAPPSAAPTAVAESAADEPTQTPPTQEPQAQEPDAEDMPAESLPPEPEPLSEDAVSALDGIRALMEEGRCYDAFREMLAFEETNQDGEALSACEALFSELDLRLRELEPESGTELARTFTVQGGCVLEVNAFSGPALVTVADTENYVRFYVRQGEHGETHLPAGTYRVGYQVGYRWFGEEDGFGEYCTEGMLEEPLYFDFYTDGSWASNAKFTITL